MRFRGLMFRCVAAVTVAFAALLLLSYRLNQGASVYPKSNGSGAETSVSSAGGDGKMEPQIRRRDASASDGGYRGDGEDESEDYEYIYRGPEMFANETRDHIINPQNYEYVYNKEADFSNMKTNDDEYYNGDQDERDVDQGEGDEDGDENDKNVDEDEGGVDEDEGDDDEEEGDAADVDGKGDNEDKEDGDKDVEDGDEGEKYGNEDERDNDGDGDEGDNGDGYEDGDEDEGGADEDEGDGDEEEGDAANVDSKENNEDNEDKEDGDKDDADGDEGDKYGKEDEGDNDGDGDEGDNDVGDVEDGDGDEGGADEDKGGGDEDEGNGDEDEGDGDEGEVDASDADGKGNNEDEEGGDEDNENGDEDEKDGSEDVRDNNGDGDEGVGDVDEDGDEDKDDGNGDEGGRDEDEGDGDVDDDEGDVDEDKGDAADVDGKGDNEGKTGGDEEEDGDGNKVDAEDGKKDKKAKKDRIKKTSTAELHPPRPEHKIPDVIIFTHYVDLLSNATFSDPEDYALSDNVRNTIELHPTARVRFLTDEDCVASIVKVMGPDSQLPNYFRTETRGMYKADICRGAALYETGGLYFDVDIQARMSMWNVVQADTEFVVPKVHRKSKVVGSFFQAFIGVVPQSPVIMRYLEMFVEYYEGRRKVKGALGVVLLREAYDEVESVHAVSQLWMEERYSAEKFPDVEPTAGERRACHFVVAIPGTAVAPFYSRIRGSRMCGGKDSVKTISYGTEKAKK